MLGQSLIIFYVVFLVVGLQWVVPAQLGFQDLVFGDLTSMLSFIVRGRLYGLLISFHLSFPLCSLISFQFTSMFMFLVFLSFAMFVTPGLDSVFLCVCFFCAWKVISSLKLDLWFLSGYLSFSLPQVIYFLPMLSLVQVCEVNLLEIWSLLSRALWFFLGMGLIV